MENENIEEIIVNEEQPTSGGPAFVQSTTESNDVSYKFIGWCFDDGETIKRVCEENTSYIVNGETLSYDQISAMTDLEKYETGFKQLFCDSRNIIDYSPNEEIAIIKETQYTLVQATTSNGVKIFSI